MRTPGCPVTVTAATSPRSAGGKHDFFSEGDYWWPDPANPKGPYIQRDGMTNPDNFVEHRRAMIRLSLAVPALAAAFKDGRQDRLDGLSVDYDDWWFNVRPSNTEPVLRLNLEAKTPELLEAKKAAVVRILKG